MKIVLTGGPSAGKTSLIEILYRNYWDRLCIVPEAASILFHGGFPRGSAESQLKCQQRAIYHVQKELEQLGDDQAKEKMPAQSLICDRGSLDGLAYWPGDKDSFFAAVQSDMNAELARYDWVIHLETASHVGYKSTRIRIESEQEARLLDEKVKNAWNLHPNRLIICNSTEFIAKVEKAVGCVEMILGGASKAAITESMSLK